MCNKQQGDRERALQIYTAVVLRVFLDVFFGTDINKLHTCNTRLRLLLETPKLFW
jgi:hypothetical protein